MVYDTIIFHFPMIWFGMPPLLKLWIDEVFDMKWLSYPDTSPVKGKSLYCIDYGGSQNAYTPDGIYGNPAEDYIKTLTQSLKINLVSVEDIIIIYNSDQLSDHELNHQCKTSEN